MASYNRVPYSDRDRYHLDSDDQQYSDNLINHNYELQRNGVSDLYEVELRPEHYKPGIKVLCCKCKNTKPVKIVMLLALIVFVLAGIVVLVLIFVDRKSSSSPSSDTVKQTTYSTTKVKEGSTQRPVLTTLHPHNKPSSYGLFAFGPDENGYVSFDPMDQNTYMSYINRLEHALNDYSSTQQMSDPNKYIKCHEDMKSVPLGKVCMLTTYEFGTQCQHLKLYGITEARPCILLELKLESGFTPKPYNFSDGQNAFVKEKLGDRATTNSVGISCEGKTDLDKTLLGSRLYDGPKVNYSPREGFPFYYFLQQNRMDYVNPAVMVQFNTIPTKRLVTVRCTAWAANFNNGIPQQSAKFTTDIMFNLG